MHGEEGRAREVPVEAEPLGHVSRAGADPEVVDRASFDGEAPGVGPQKPEQAGEQRRLAGAVGADQAERFAAAHLERHAVERAGPPAEAPVGLGHRVDGNHGRDDTDSGFREYGLFFGAFSTRISTMIEVQGLSKRYPTRLAVDDVTFSVKQGEIVGFLGPNGAGKTTTMRVLTGFLPPTSGMGAGRGTRRRGGSRRRRAPRSDTCPSPRPPTSRCGSASTCRSARASKGSRAGPCAGASPRRWTSACSARSPAGRSRACRRGSASARRWPGRSSTSRPFSCSTSRRSASTRCRSSRSARRSACSGATAPCCSRRTSCRRSSRCATAC